MSSFETDIRQLKQVADHVRFELYLVSNFFLIPLHYYSVDMVTK